jgi:hypothetical protein
MNIVFSRKDFDDQYGSTPLVIWPSSREMLSFPIPVKSPEKGHRAEELSFAMMDPFHAIWGFLEVDGLIDIDPNQSGIEYRQCPFAWCKTFGPNALIRG